MTDKKTENNRDLKNRLYHGTFTPSGLMKLIFSQRASIKDMEINNRLLKELITGYAESQKKLSLLNRELKLRQDQLEKDLEAAAGIQKSLLPHKIPKIHDIDFAWEFLPSDKVGGDIFNVFTIDNANLGIFILDVSGHGVPASLVTVSVSQVLDPRHSDLIRNQTFSPPYYKIVSPSEVLTALDRQYPMERFDKYFSIVYAVINLKSMTLTYSSAGHPPPVMIQNKSDLSYLDKGGTLIGLGGIMPFEEEAIALSKGDKIIFYTDGVTEASDKNGGLFADSRFEEVLNQSKSEPVAAVLKTLLDAVIDFEETRVPRDDVSLLGLEIK